MQSQTPPAPSPPASSVESQEDALDRLLNDADAPFDPDRVWQMLADLARETGTLNPTK